jgi:hypothetical protein
MIQVTSHSRLDDQTVTASTPYKKTRANESASLVKSKKTDKKQRTIVIEDTRKDSIVDIELPQLTALPPIAKK